MKVPELVTLGETMVVLAATVLGPMRYSETFRRAAGGAESNVAIGVVRLGHTAGWISRLGDDELGRYLLATIRGEGVDVSQVRLDPDAPTGLYLKDRPAAGDPSVLYYRRGSAASRLSPADLDPAYIRGARVLHLTGITPALSEGCRETVRAALGIAREAGVLVSFDPNFRRRLWPEAEAAPVFRELAARADLLLPGLAEGEIMTGLREPEAIARALLDLGPGTVVLKLGPEGALLADAGGIRHIPGFPMSPVDTVGAGDAFAAAFLAGVLEGIPRDEAVRWGCAAGALATQTPGDWEGIPERSRLAAFLAGRGGGATR